MLSVRRNACFGGNSIRRAKLRIKWKEYFVTILLWTALIGITGYVIVLLFPEQTIKWKQMAGEMVQKTVTRIEQNIQSGESKLVAYISSNQINSSILNQLTPIVSYVEHNMQNNVETEGQVIQQQGTDATVSSESSPSETTNPQAIQESTSVPTELSQNTTTAAPEEPPTAQTMPESTSAAAVAAAPVLLSKIEQLVSAGSYSRTQILDYNYLIDTFYVVDKSTSLPQEILNPAVLLSKDLTFQTDNSKPQILIYHTHSQEAFADSVPGQRSDTIVGMGDYLTQLLTENYGYQVIHHTGVYDMTDGKLDRNPAYTKALPEITKILEQNPSIEVVIDLHRDGVNENVHLVTEVNGQPTAKIMLFNGLCRDAQKDNPEILNRYREDNLAFSLQLAMLMKAQYPDLFRVIYTKSNRYNQHLRPRSALIECGAQTNTVQEVKNTMPILADLIHQVLEP